MNKAAISPRRRRAPPLPSLPLAGQRVGRQRWRWRRPATVRHSTLPFLFGRAFFYAYKLRVRVFKNDEIVRAHPLAKYDRQEESGNFRSGLIYFSISN